jgi:hypothetical protein
VDTEVIRTVARLSRPGDLMLRGELGQVDAALRRVAGQLGHADSQVGWLDLRERGDPALKVWAFGTRDDETARNLSLLLRKNAAVWSWCRLPPNPLLR